MRYLITGGSGYIGSRLTERFLEAEETERIVVADVRPPRQSEPRIEHARLDVRDGRAARELVARVKPDALVHLAFILNPIKDEDAMYDIDVNGTHNVLEAAAAAGTERVLVTSSTVAYGAFPDNPVPLEEDHPVRGVPEFEYACDKTESDRLCQLWGLRHPDRTMTIVRPCIVFGPNVDNYLVRLWTNQPFQADLGGPDLPTQFVHEDDLVEAVYRLLVEGHGGAFNVTGDGVMTATDCAELIGMRRLRVPFRPYRAFASLMWRLGVAEAPPGALQYARHPWIASNEKVKRTLGWEPRHTSRETFEITMRAHGKLPDGARPQQAETGESSPAEAAAPGRS